jgi:hypothetical protein
MFLTRRARIPRNKFLFPIGNQARHQIFDMSGTFSVVAAQQILNTISAE